MTWTILMKCNNERISMTHGNVDMKKKMSVYMQKCKVSHYVLEVLYNWRQSFPSP